MAPPIRGDPDGVHPRATHPSPLHIRRICTLFGATIEVNFRRTPADSVNTLEAESVIFAGKAPQLGEWRQNAWRWGDYSAMSIDPVDDRTFWYTNEYVTSRHFKPNWSTRIASFKFPGCATP